jgi:uncharacterized protein (DUF1499 family)
MRALILIPVLILAAAMILSLLSRRGAPSGLVDGRLAPLASKPNGVSSEAGTSEAKRVDPLSTDKAGLLAAIRATGGTVQADEADYVAATYTTPLMRYVDDVEFRRDGDLWHVRSASRVGHSDMGANRKRIDAVRAALG